MEGLGQTLQVVDFGQTGAKPLGHALCKRRQAGRDPISQRLFVPAMDKTLELQAPAAAPALSPG